MKPITPSEVTAKKAKAIPADVIEAFNTLIAKNFSGNQSVVKQDAVLELIVAKLDIPRQFIFSEGWLNVEELYEAAGWEVEYDKPAHNEIYPATFTFRIKKL